jgi:hypothetical protein
MRSELSFGPPAVPFDNIVSKSQIKSSLNVDKCGNEGQGRNLQAVQAGSSR